MIDTNVIIDNFGNKLPANAIEFLSQQDIIISAVTKIEVLGWKDATAHQLKPLYAFMKLVIILPLSEEVIDTTISIRQSKKIALGDALIAATALVNDLVLLTRNISDFNLIDGLQVIDPHSL